MYFVIVIIPMGMKRIVRILLAGVMACTLHLHLPALQVVAWGGMLIRYSQEAPLREAVSKTFDGEHPCELCLAIREEVQEMPSNQLRATPPPEGSLIVLWATPTFYLSPSMGGRWALALPRPPSRSYPPDVPPPRGSVAA